MSSAAPAIGGAGANEEAPDEAVGETCDCPFAGGRDLRPRGGAEYGVEHDHPFGDRHRHARPFGILLGERERLEARVHMVTGSYQSLIVDFGDYVVVFEAGQPEATVPLEGPAPFAGLAQQEAAALQHLFAPVPDQGQEAVGPVAHPVRAGLAHHAARLTGQQHQGPHRRAGAGGDRRDGGAARAQRVGVAATHPVVAARGGRSVADLRSRAFPLARAASGRLPVRRRPARGACR